MNKPKEYEDEVKVYLIKDCNIDENNFFCGLVNGTPVAGKSFAKIVVTRLKMSKNR